MALQNTLTNLFSDALPFPLEWLPPTACLVGGAVRDALLNCHRDYLDLDFVLPQLAVETAQSIANRYHAGFVVLDAHRRIARVVFKHGTVDFAQQEGDSLETDLRRRDFTINAIAYNFHQQKLIDPLQGLQDLQQGILRMVSLKNLKDDPLRLLRAYRQAAQLDFLIEAQTQATIRQLAPLIRTVAAERIQTELGYLLGNKRGSYWLTEIGKDGLLQPWLKHLNEENLHQLWQVDQASDFLKESLGEKRFCQFLKPQLDKNQDYLLTIQRAKLASLVSKTPEEAELELLNLKYSRADIRAVTKALTYLPWLQNNQGKINLRQLYFFFLEITDIFPVLAIIAMAVGIETAYILPLIHRYLDPHDQVAHPRPLVNGHDLLKNLNIQPSPKLGKLLTEIQIARIEGKISTVEDALKFAELYWESS